MSQDPVTIAVLAALTPISILVAPRESLWLWRHGNNPLYDQYYRGKKP